MRAAAKTSASACMTIPDDAVKYFMEAATDLLEESESAEDVVARCLAAISRRSTDVQSRSLITGELGLASVQMSYEHDKRVSPGDVMFTVGKLSRMSSGDQKFDSDVGKIQTQNEEGTAIFDLGVSIICFDYYWEIPSRLSNSHVILYHIGRGCKAAC